MATLRNKRKLSVVAIESQEERFRNTVIPRFNEDYITQGSEEIEGRVTKNLSQEFSRTETRILGAQSKLDEFLLEAQLRTQSGTVPETSPSTDVENLEPNEGRSQNDPRAEVGSSVYQFHFSVDSDPYEAP